MRPPLAQTRPATARGTRKGSRGRALSVAGLAAYRADLVALALLGLALALLLAYAAALPPARFALTAEQLPSRTALFAFYGLERNDAATYRWSKPGATIGIELDAPGDYRLTLRLAGSPDAPPDRTVAIRVNDRPIGTFRLEPALRDYTVAFRADPAWWVATESHLAVVALDTTPYAPPGDPRLLGALVAGLALDATPAQPWQPDLIVPCLLLLVAGYAAARVAGATTWAAASGAGGVLVALGFLALGQRRALRALAELPDLYPLALAAIVALLGAVALVGWWLRREARTEPDAAAPDRLFWRRALLLGAFLLLCYGFFLQRGAWNEFSRFNLVRAIVDDGTTSIDPYRTNTGDVSFANGHYRSDKVPGLSFLALPFYALLRALTAGSPLGPLDPERLLPPVTLAVVGIPTAITALLIAHYLRRRVGDGWALALGAGYGLATLALPFGTMLFGHATAACFLFASFVVLAEGEGGRSWRRYLLAGFLGGWAVLTELPAALGVAIIFAYAIWRDRRAIVPLVAGGLPLGLVFLGYNWVAFGSPWTVGYAHLIDAEMGDGMSRGLLGVTLPRLPSLIEITIGPFGLFRLAPWLLCAAAGAWAGWRATRGAERGQVAACAAICLGFVTYNAAYYTPLGGWSAGPRFLIPALPFAVALVGLAPRRWRACIGAQMACAAAFLLAATFTDPKPSPDYHDPLADLWLPRLLSSDLVGTSASVHWGLAGTRSLLAFALAAIAAGGALALVGRRRRPLARLGAGCAALLLACLLAFGFPLDLRPARPVGGATDGHSAAVVAPR